MSGSDHRILIGAGKIYSDISQRKRYKKDRRADRNVFYDGNHGWPERIELQSDGNLQCLRMLWALSGIYDLYRSITVFYSMFQVESALLCTDKLL